MAGIPTEQGASRSGGKCARGELKECGEEGAYVPRPALLPSPAMEVKLKYRGRAVTDADLVFISDLVQRHPDASRRQLSGLLCEAWNWRQPNGELRDMVCRSLMLLRTHHAQKSLRKIGRHLVFMCRGRSLPQVSKRLRGFRKLRVSTTFF